MKFFVGLADADGLEISYPGYTRVPATMVLAENSNDWINSETLAFQEFRGPGGRDVSMFSLYDESRWLVTLPFTCRMHLDAYTRVLIRTGDIAMTGESAAVFADLMAHLRILDVPMPSHCKKCNHYNEYVGTEHLVNGDYVCRSCR